MLLTIKNPYLFISQETGEPIDTSQINIRKTLPRQYPKGVNATEMEEVAVDARKGMEAVVFLHIIAQFFFESNVEDLWSLFFFSQLVAHFSMYEVKMPGNVEVYIEQLRHLVDFEIFKPERIIQII